MKFHLIATYYQGQHTYCNRGTEKDNPPVNWATCRTERIVNADTIEEAKQKLIDYVWDRMDDRYSETEWAVTKDKIYIDSKYEEI